MTEFIEKLIESKGYKICPNCDGDGDFIGEIQIVKCEKCKGKGVIDTLPDHCCRECGMAFYNCLCGHE